MNVDVLELEESVPESSVKRECSSVFRATSAISSLQQPESAAIKKLLVIPGRLEFL